MNATELRIGNWINVTRFVNGKETIQNIKVTGIDKSGAIDVTQPDETFDSKLATTLTRPIRLTEPILLKIGFKRYGEKPSLYLNFNDFLSLRYTNNAPLLLGVTQPQQHYIANLDPCQIPDIIMTKTLTTVDAEYLHQLQNLYFALTGAELNVTL